MFDIGIFDPEVTIRGNSVKISSVRRRYLERDLTRVMGSSRISTYMITNQSGMLHITIHLFFVLEFYYVIDKLLATEKYLFTNVRTLRKIQEILMKETWLGNTIKTYPSRLNYSNIDRLHFKPLPYQEEFIRHYDKTMPSYNLKGMLLAADPGTGKTYTSIAIAECLDADKVIVIAPKPAVDRVWVASVNKDKTEGGLYHKPQTCWAKLFDRPYKQEKFAIFHYEALETALSMVKELQGKKTVIILDESHNLNEMKSLRTQKFLELCERIKTNDVLFMTGTPVKAMSLETIPLLKAIDPYFDDKAIEIFKKIYSGQVSSITSILARRYNIVSYKISKDETKLNDPIHKDMHIKVSNQERYLLSTIGEEMARFTLNRTKELEKEYPKCRKEFDDLLKKHSDKLSGKDLIEYNKYIYNLNAVMVAYKKNQLSQHVAEMKFCTDYEKNVILPTLSNKKDRDKFLYNKTVVKYLKLKARGECLGQILVRKRIDAYKTLIENIPFEEIIESTEKKTVIFTTYTDVIRETISRLEKLNYKPLAVYGEHTKNLSSIVKDFDKKKHYNPLVATYASLSTAVPLVMADTMIIINPPFRQYIMDQTVARIHRLGATTQTRVYNIILDTGDEENISTRTINIMEWSKQQVNAILGLDYQELDSDQNVSLEDLAIEYPEDTVPDKVNSSSILDKWCS